MRSVMRLSSLLLVCRCVCKSCGVLVCCLFTLCVAGNVCDLVAVGVGCECICCNWEDVFGACMGMICASDGTAAMLVCVFVS